MPTITWTLTVNDAPHTIRLEHGKYSGRRQVYLDEQLVAEARHLIDYGSRHPFTVQGQPVEVMITTNGLTFTYFLVHAGLPIPSDADQRAGRTQARLLRSRRLKDWDFWQDLSKALGLSYLPKTENGTALRHRLVGSFHGLDVFMQDGFVSSTNTPAWYVVVHHAKPLLPQTGDRLRADPRLKPVFKRTGQPGRLLHHEPTHTWIVFPQKRRESAAALAVHVHAFLEVLPAYLSPVPANVCENPACRQGPVSEHRLILINNIPWYYCPECIAAIPAMGEQAHREYQKAPNNVWCGLAAGAGAALLAALAIALADVLVTVFSFLPETLPALLAMYPMIAIVIAANKAGVKAGWQRLLIGAFLTPPAVLLGFLGGSIGKLLLAGAQFSPDLVPQAWRALLSAPRPLNVALLIAALIAAPIIYLILSAHKSLLNQAFHPRVEVLPDR